MKKLLVYLTVLLTACSQQVDIKSFPKIDAHVHLETSDDSFIEYVADKNFKLLTLVTRSVSQDLITEEFDWLFVDFERLRIAAEELGLSANIIYQNEHHQYLAKIS